MLIGRVALAAHAHDALSDSGVDAVRANVCAPACRHRSRRQYDHTLAATFTPMLPNRDPAVVAPRYLG